MSAGFARRAAVVAVAAALAVSGCSSSSSDGGSSTTQAPVGATTTPDTATVAPAGWKAPSCDRGVTEAAVAKPVKGSDSDYDLTSFDGTKIRIHWFPRDAAGKTDSPTILMGPGWGQPGDTNTDPDATVAVQGFATIPGLHKAGYNVVTWDPRGFGESGGTVSIDSADFEAKDVSALIDWVSAQPGVELDAPGNPRVGMVGGSYGGGIQFVTAATDCRVDVITPTIAWNSLATSLYPAETFKAGWAGILMMVSGSSNLDPHISAANDDATATGVLSQADRSWFVDRGPDNLLSDIHIPTLIVQGTVDNLFPLSEGVRNYQALSANGIPLAMTWFCGGHGVCNDPADPDTYVTDATMNWLARWLKHDTKAAAVPGFQTTDQSGKVHTFGAYPPAATARPVFTFTDSGTLELQPDGGSGPLTEAPKGDVVGSLAVKITPAKADKALNVPVTFVGDGRLLVGAPELGLGYTCTLDGDATKPTRIFAQIVDDATGRVLGNQITPIDTICDGLMHLVRTPLEEIAYAPPAGETEAKLTLQLVASTVAYGEVATGGEVDFSRIVLTIPTVTG